MKRLFFCIFLINMLILSGCGKNNTSVSKTDFYFDTVVTITLYGDDNEKYIDDCFDICDKYEKLLSRTCAGSDIDNINKAKGKAVTVSDDTLELLKAGLDYCDLSEGKFDITIGGVSSLWDFDSDNPALPNKTDIERELKSVNYHNVIIDGNNVSLADPDTIIDLGGIAKGFIADKLKSYLLSNNVNSGIIDLGGNILLIGSKTDGSDYNIGIKKPFSDTGETSAIVKTSNKSIVSSGNYERYFYKDDKLYHHILNTSTGYPIENNLYSVSIISDSSIDGDGLSTTCFASGLDEGMKLIERTDNTEAIFIDSNYKIYYTSGLKEKNGVVTIK